MKKPFLTTLITSVAISLVAAALPAYAGSSLDAALDAQADEAKVRYQYRHPKETLTFFGIEPGMTVVEALPGGGWYSKILIPYLGKDGRLVGVDYDQEMWQNFGFMTPERIEERKTWVDTWTAEAAEWRGENGAEISAYKFNAVPEDAAGTADAILFIRAMHNLARFEEKGGFMTQALKDAHTLLKPGGIFGVVQHRARDDRPDAWADGSSGYLKKDKVIKAMEAAGFEFVGESDVNENDKDQATEGDIVWRLAPSYATSRDDEEKQKEIQKLGESHRMTLKFRKPA